MTGRRGAVSFILKETFMRWGRRKKWIGGRQRKVAKKKKKPHGIGEKKPYGEEEDLQHPE